MNLSRRPSRREPRGDLDDDEEVMEVHLLSLKVTIPPLGFTPESVHTLIKAQMSSSSRHYAQLKKTPQSLLEPPTPTS